MQQTLDKDSQLFRIRHSLAHVLAQAVQQYRPGTTLGFGPPIADGFYYDFILPEPISSEDLPKIEKLMKKIIKRNQRFSFEDLPAEQALERLAEMGEPHKAEYARELIAKNGLDCLRFYTNGPFVDMCEGPHVETTREIPRQAFKLRSVAGAYWRGDEKNAMMTRIYAWAYESAEELEAQVTAYEERQKRDHRKLGQQLDLFVIDQEIGRGLPLWLPHGTVLREELEKLAKELEFKAGWQRVATPHLAKSELYHRTGHLPYYAADMYPQMELKETQDGVEVVTERYTLRPMNCPHHHKIFAARPRSYRDLPLRLAEFGQVYRFEDSGSLSGLLRVRGMCQNDGHIYCTREQIESEFVAVMKMHKTLYELFGFDDFYMRLSCWDPEDPKGKEKYVDDPAAWDESQDVIRRAMQNSGIPFTEAVGEAAFYGPKIDFQMRTVTGREETASTNQLDFAIPKRLGLVYTGSDGQDHHPYCIHRAPLGTHERFVSFLIEHFAGAFPTWLAPIQVRILPVSEKTLEFACSLEQQLRDAMIRAEVDRGAEKVGKKIRNALTHKIPNVLVVGPQEAEQGTVTWRRYGVKEQQSLPRDAFCSEMLRRIAARKD